MLGSFTDPADRTTVQSGLMLLHPRERQIVWEKWRTDPAGWMKQYAGDQDFLQSCAVDWARWQEALPGAVVSYKYHLRPGRDRDGRRLERGQVKVICYHGKPRPWEVEDADDGERAVGVMDRKA